MAAFRDDGDLRRWLDGQPVQVARLIAVRAALIALPAVTVASEYRQFQSISLGVFRANAIAWAAIFGYERATAASRAFTFARTQRLLMTAARTLAAWREGSGKTNYRHSVCR